MAGVLRDLAGLLGDVDRPEGWIAALRFGVAGGLAELGEGAAAAPLFRQLLAQNPAHPWAWIGLIGIAMERGDAVGALALGREALGYLPEDRLLRRKAAEAAEAAEGPGAALAILCDQPVAGMDEADLVFAIALHRSAGRVTEAGEFCARLIARSPGEAVAHLALIEGALTQGDAEAARVAAEAAVAHHPDHPEIILRAAQAFRMAGDGARAVDLCLSAPEGSAFASWFLALRAEIAEERGEVAAARELWSDALAIGQGDVSFAAQEALSRLDPSQEAAADAVLETGDAFVELEVALATGKGAVEVWLAQVEGHSDLPWFVAVRLLDRLWQAGRGVEAERLVAACAAQVWPEADRLAFDLERLLVLDGAFAALDHARSRRVVRRDAEACERLGRVLLAAGKARLAARYLRAAVRRWPGDGAILTRATEAMIACGSAEQVAALLDGPWRQAPEAARLACRVAAALAEGDPAAAVAACAGRQDAPPPMDLIEAQLLSGDLQGAEASLARLSVGDGPEAEALICRPRATRLGSLLNEARVLAAVAADWPEGSGGLEPEFFLAARAALVAVDPMQDGTRPQAEVPGALHLIWRGGVPPPDVVGRMANSWRSATRRAVRFWEPAGAMDWIGQALGHDIARACRQAQDAEQRADLLALAVLLVEGGMMCAAEQVPGGGIDDLADGGGATLFLEGTGGVSFDAMIAPPGHSVITAALEAATQACLSGENGHRWFKTGPGLMTRVVARSLADGGADPCLYPASRLRQVLHPCWPLGTRSGGVD